MNLLAQQGISIEDLQNLGRTGISVVNSNGYADVEGSRGNKNLNVGTFNSNSASHWGGLQNLEGQEDEDEVLMNLGGSYIKTGNSNGFGNVMTSNVHKNLNARYFNSNAASHSGGLMNLGGTDIRVVNSHGFADVEGSRGNKNLNVGTFNSNAASHWGGLNLQ